MKINTKILVYTLITSIVIFTGIIGYVAFEARKKAFNDAKQIADAIARENANYAKAKLQKYLTATRTVAQLFEDRMTIPPKQRRRIYASILKKLLKDNTDYLSVWTIWEPNAIDNMDSLFINAPGCTKIGNFATTYYRYKNRIKLEDSSTEGELFVGEYYTIPKNTRNEVILNPYSYSYTGDENDAILQTSTIVPIIRQNDFLGVVGIDVELGTFQIFVQRIKPFREGYVFLVANDGSYIAHPNQSLIGKKISEAAPNLNRKYNITEKIKQGEPFEIVDKNMKDNELSYFSFAPFTIGNTNTSWSFAVVAPKKTIMATANNMFYLSIILAIIGVVILSFILWIISNKITHPLRKIANQLKQLNKGNSDELQEIADNAKDEIGDIAKSTNMLIQWINRTGEFAEKIGEGNLETDYKLFNENDELGKALIELRNEMKEARKKDIIRQKENKNRSWATEGIAKFAEILRQNKEINELSYDIIRNLVTYTDANQGGFFLINDNDKKDVYIEQTACFAYNEKRIVEKRFEFGEGLIGRCILEKETIFLTEVPPKYIEITSGLGEATPRCLLIVPLIHNEDVFGVIELASFNVFEQYQIDFIEKVSESIAVTISNAKINQKTARLLDESNQKSDELASKEQEMRLKNQELIETQEEMRKKQEELKKVLNQTEKTKKQLQEEIEAKELIIQSYKKKYKS